MAAEKEDPATLREVIRELSHMAIALEQLAGKMEQGFASIRQDMLRRDVFESREELLQSKIKGLEDDVSMLQLVKRNQNAAIGGMLLTIIGGIVVFLLTRGIVA